MLQLPSVYELMPKYSELQSQQSNQLHLVNPNRETISSLNNTSPLNHPLQDYFLMHRQSVSSAISMPSPQMERPPLPSSNSDSSNGSTSGVRLPSLPAIINNASQSSYSHTPQIHLPPVAHLHQLPNVIPTQENIQQLFPPLHPAAVQQQQLVPLTQISRDVPTTKKQLNQLPPPHMISPLSTSLQAGVYPSFSGGNTGPTAVDNLVSPSQTFPPGLIAPPQQPGPVYYYPTMYPPNYGYPQYSYPPMNYGENQIIVSKRRIIKRRTRTGCLTCRKRRIKCDERKPGCFNCERSKKVCLGYENLQKSGKKKRDRSLDLRDDEEDESSHDEEDKLCRRVSVDDVMN